MLGVHFAISAEQERLLLAAEGNPDAVSDLHEDIEENWGDDPSVSSDKAWDAMHRCLGDGTLDPDGGAYPLSHAIVGGRHLHDEFYVVYVSAAEVQDVAEALHRVDKAWLRQRFDALDSTDYDGSRDDEDFEYTWENFTDVRAFYGHAATAGRAVIFTAT